MKGHGSSRSQQLSEAERALVNPLNCSKSKQMYSFNKQRRFSRSKTEGNLTHYYPSPPITHHAPATFAKAKRELNKPIPTTPGPSEYTWNKQGEFSMHRTMGGTKTLGFTIAKADSVLPHSYRRQV